MGEYEDRYPDAYGRDETPAPGSQPDERKEGQPRQGRDRLPPRSVGAVIAPTQAVSPNWQHLPNRPAPIATPTAPRPAELNYRGVGPRGYVRSPERVYEDVCDRLTDHPLIDASDIEVVISGVEVTLRGSVKDPIAAGRAETIAREVPGVSSVRNTLSVRSGGHR